MNPLRIIILTENPALVTEPFRAALAQRGLEILCKKTAAEAVITLSQDAVHALALDIVDGRDATAVILSLRASYSTIPIILISNDNQGITREKALQSGAMDMINSNALTPALFEKTIRHGMERLTLSNRSRQDSGQLELREKQQKEIIAAAPDGIMILDNEGRIHFMNPSAEQMMGGKLEVYLHQVPDFSIAPGERGEISISHKNGSVHTAEIAATDIEWQGEKMLLLSLRDITPERCLLARWAEEKEWVAVTLESIADGVIGVDNNNRIRLLNNVAEEMTGWNLPEASGRKFSEVVRLRNNHTGLFLEEFNNDFFNQCRILEGMHAAEESWVLVSRRGKDYAVEFSCSPIRRRDCTSGMVLVIRDVAEKRAMEDELIRVQNLEAIGMMAGGLAHEFNNVLTSTLGSLSLARKMMPDDTPEASRLQKAIDAGLRAREIPNRLSAFLKSSELKRTRCRLQDLLNEAATELMEEPGVRLEWRVLPASPSLKLDADAIRLTFKNIFRNAIEAVNRNGRIEISLDAITIDRSQKKILNIKAGQYYKITVRDNGPGIAPADFPKIFDPFFTTRNNAEGMGLTTAYSIIRRHGGAIRVEPGEPNGCAIVILLPGDPPTEEPMKTEASVNRTEKPASGKGRVLVMDDEESVREIIQEMLEFLNFDVTLAETGEEAIQIYQMSLETQTLFDAVILDLVVPGGMSGKECIDRLLELDPQIKAIVSSGYSHDPVMNSFREYGFLDVLPKPYKIQELNAVLKRVMESP